MWATFAIVGLAIVVYSLEKVPLEVTSLATIAILLVIFDVAPIPNEFGQNLLDAKTLLAGFADPALVAVISLLVIGQGLVQTGALDRPAQTLLEVSGNRTALVVIIALIVVAIVSGFLNNTPVVVIFIPIMAALAERMGRTASTVMIPLSFAAILGGMTTLIGSSTNLLVSGTLETLGHEGLGFFDFSITGAVLASVGMVYLLFVAPFLIPKREALTDSFTADTGRQFIAEIDVIGGRKLDGETAVAGLFKSLPDMTVRLIQRGEHAILPPFDDVTLQQGDMVIVAATRAALSEFFSHEPDLIEGVGDEARRILMREPDKRQTSSRMLAEVVVAPASRLDGRTLALSGFHSRTGCIVLGIQRRSRMLRAAMNDIRLEAGDVLLVTGRRSDVTLLRDNPDILLLEWSTRELPRRSLAGRALLIFGGVVVAAATNTVPIVIAALTGVALMIFSRCLNIRQAARAVDRRIVLIIASALAMGAALYQTGGASYLAHSLIDALQDQPVPIILSAFFLLVAALTNVLSNNATAVLFTPIALNVAAELGAPALPFIFAVIFGANCSFATPMSYQTNLLVMGPGHYRFSDFVRAGTPLIFLIWITFSLFAPWYFGLY